MNIETKEFLETLIPEKAQKAINEMKAILSNGFIEWLEERDFFIVPASTKYHGAYPGGLAEHSWEVYKCLKELTEKMELYWEYSGSPFLIAIVHDLCKCDLYEPVIFMDKTNPSEPKPTLVEWKYNDSSIFSHHAEKSIAMICSCPYAQLTEEEVACIRWHMGAYEKDTNEWKYYNNAITKYPNVFWTHTADMMASHLRGI